MPTGVVRTTVVVVTWRGADRVGDCLDALAAQGRAHRVLVVDNASDDGTAAVLAAHPAAGEILRLPRNTGYAGGIAAGVERVRTPLVAWLNDDACPSPGWLAALEDALAEDVAAVGSRLYSPDGAVQSVGSGLTADGYGYDVTAGGSERFGFCGGAALLRMDALRAVGGVPARFFCYYEDTDTSWRLRLAGWRVSHAAGATVTHQHGASSAIGSPAFHRWNERNRLWTLVRCAPVSVAAYQLVRFATLTAVLPARSERPDTPNFRFRLRSRVLAEVLAALPGVLAERRDIGRRARLRRADVWRKRQATAGRSGCPRVSLPAGKPRGPVR